MPLLWLRPVEAVHPTAAQAVGRSKRRSVAGGGGAEGQEGRSKRKSEAGGAADGPKRLSISVPEAAGTAGGAAAASPATLLGAARPFREGLVGLHGVQGASAAANRSAITSHMSAASGSTSGTHPPDGKRRERGDKRGGGEHRGAADGAPPVPSLAAGPAAGGAAAAGGGQTLAVPRSRLGCAGVAEAPSCSLADGQYVCPVYCHTSRFKAASSTSSGSSDDKTASAPSVTRWPGHGSPGHAAHALGVEDCLFTLTLPPGRRSPDHWVIRNVALLVCADPASLVSSLQQS